jgi:glutamate racemase
VAQRYLRELGTPGTDYDTLVLGCTHFPLLEPLIRRLVGPDLPIIDSAGTTAGTVQRHLEMTRPGNPPPHQGTSRFLVTDAPERFSRIAARFVGGESFIPGNKVFHANIGEISAPEAAPKRAASGSF